MLERDFGKDRDLESARKFVADVVAFEPQWPSETLAAPAMHDTADEGIREGSTGTHADPCATWLRRERGTAKGQRIMCYGAGQPGLRELGRGCPGALGTRASPDALRTHGGGVLITVPVCSGVR